MYSVVYLELEIIASCIYICSFQPMFLVNYLLYRFCPSTIHVEIIAVILIGHFGRLLLNHQTEITININVAKC